jgi:hypothetical protein
MTPRYRFPTLLSIPLGIVLAIAAAGGLFVPAVYAREAPSWAAQGTGQDWVDLVLVAPSLLALAAITLRGSRVAALLLAGVLAYACYSFVLYAFFMHFGPLFLVYTAALGLAFYALVGMTAALQSDDVRGWFRADASVGLAGGLAAAVGLLYAAVWLEEAVPALAAGTMPRSASEVGLITNPVQVLDLGIVLPAFVAAGIALIRRRALGYWLVPVMLSFAVVMDLALIGMTLSMAARGIAPAAPRIVVFGVMTLITGVVLGSLMRQVRPVANP